MIAQPEGPEMTVQIRNTTPEDAAARVLPAVAPLCVDAVHEVRASALACVHHFTKVLVEHNVVLDKKAAALQQSEPGGGEKADEE